MSVCETYHINNSNTIYFEKIMYKKAIFIFRRDLRLFDNTALNYACHMSEIIIPCFYI